MSTVAAIVLAAGRGLRFGAADHDSKILQTIDGTPFVRRVTLTALASAARPVVVVTGHAAASVADVLQDLPIRTVHNPAYRSGMAGSLKTGLAALPQSVDGMLVLLADMPLVVPATLDALIAAFAGAPHAPDAVVPCHAGRRGNPILLGRRMFDGLATLDGDTGARQLLADAGRDVLVHPVDDPAVLLDIDTPDMLRALRSRA